MLKLAPLETPLPPCYNLHAMLDYEQRIRQDQLAHYLLKSVAKAQRLYRLFEPHDRIAVAVSGGKDSATLLELMRRWQGWPRFSLMAIHVLSDESGCGPATSSAQLSDWFESIAVPYRIVRTEPTAHQPARQGQSPCFHCAWRRRKALFQTAHAMECNKLALAHHADDVAITLLLNLFFQGRFETMQPCQKMFGGALTIIRPLYLIEERDILAFVRSGFLPFAPITCTAMGDRRRTQMAALLRQIETNNRHVKRSLMNALEHAAASPASKAVANRPTGTR